MLAANIMVLVLAMVISMALIPLFVRYAPVLGMVDLPDPRKVHVKPIPRVGGVGIVVGALVPMFVWLPYEPLFVSFLVGSMILFLFGLWDDARELGHYVKFIGQFIAVGLVVFWGDLYVHFLPLVEQPLSETGGKLFTFIAMVGMINAINHSDGLDGLAGGESLMSLIAMIYLASLADGDLAMLIGVATIGGVFGFLRYNSHPANVFMGDGGSQFLGFVLAFLAVYLTQEVNPALSPALPLLILGLPIADILAVFAQRIYHGMNWFKASKNHVHHRLLELGFRHYESVVIIYSVQLLLVASGALLPYETDALLLGIYFAVIGALFIGLYLAERAGWRFSHRDSTLPDAEHFAAFLHSGRSEQIVNLALQGLLGVFVLGTALLSERVPVEVSRVALALLVLLLVRLLLGYRVWFLYLRLQLFVCVAVFVYLFDFLNPDWVSEQSMIWVYAYFGLMVALLALAMKFVQVERFRLSPLDFLVVIMMLVAGLFAEQLGLSADTQQTVIETVVLFYAVEWVLQHMRSRWNLFTGATLAGLVVTIVRGLA